MQAARFLFCIWLMTLVVAGAAEPTAQRVVVSDESEEAEHNQFTEMGEYAQPAWAERSRFTSTTNVYVLSPFEFFAGNLWEADFDRNGRTVHELTQEIDFGLPHRFELGIENRIHISDSDRRDASAALEARYAFANWNVIPLNPAISAEYIFGIGDTAKDSPKEAETHRRPDSVSVRLLLGQNFKENIGYGLNLGLEQDVFRGSGRTFEMSQSAAYGAMNGRFELGAEMRYLHKMPGRNAADRNEFTVGPTLGWKPVRQLRVSIAPLFGCTSDSPAVASFLLVSYEFGGAESVVTPISGNW